MARYCSQMVGYFRIIIYLNKTPVRDNKLGTQVFNKSDVIS